MQLTITVDPGREVKGPLLKSLIRLADKHEPGDGIYPNGEAAAHIVRLACEGVGHDGSGSLVRGLAVLAVFGLDETVTNEAVELGVSDIAKATGFSMSTTHRYIKTLVLCGLLDRDPHTRKYKLHQSVSVSRGG